jgi:protein-S-isoprenylcysteine O-methyltransferase Ste14
MHGIKIGIGITWVVFWIYWLVAATQAKASVRGGWGFRLRGIAAIAALIMLRAFRGHSVSIHTLALGIVGAALVACGLLFAVWARLYLGSNWGMPTSQRVEPELVTSGPYRFVRHPIYSGLILALIGTALATSLYGLILVVAATAYFYWSATVEERNLTQAFPSDYPAYERRTKKLIPFLL